MNKTILIACFLAFVALATCQLPDRACPSVNVVQNFDVASYLGIWYEIATTITSKDTFERNCFCTRANYTLNEDGSVNVENSCNLDGVTGVIDIYNGTAIIPDPSEPAKLEVTFGGPYAPYWVIINDNYEQAVVWSCVSFLGKPIEYMWILSRTNTISSSDYENLAAEAEKITGYDTSTLIPTTQQGCTYPGN